MRLLNVVLSAASLLLAVAPAIASDAAGTATGSSAGSSTGPAATKPASGVNTSAAAAVAPAATSPTLTPAKKALILELLKMTDADKQVEMIINQLTLSHQRRYPTLLAQAINAAPIFQKRRKRS